MVFKAQEKYLVQEVSDAYWTHERLLDCLGREYKPASVNQTYDDHFIKDNNSRMIYSLSLQIMSALVARMMQAVVDDDLVQIGSIHNKNIRIPVIEFIEKRNRLIDVMNGRDRKYYTPENGQSTQEEMLDFLSWFTRWSDDQDMRVESGTRTEWIYFADKIWKCIQVLLLSRVCLIEFWCIGKGMTIYPRKLLTGPVEKHFGNGRQIMAGSRSGMTTSQWTTADTHATLAVEDNYTAIDNNSGA